MNYIYTTSKYFRSPTTYLKRSFSTTPTKDPTIDNQTLRRTKLLSRNKSLYVIIFVLTITYIILNILLPERKTWFTVISSSSDQGELITFQFHRDHNNPPRSLPVIPNSSANHSSELGCMIPKLDPFDKSIIMHTLRIPDDINCTKKFTLLFETLENSTIIPLTKKIRSMGYKTCCYRTIHRKDGVEYPDEGYKISNDCYPLSLAKATTVDNPKHEFLAIFCKLSSNSNQSIIIKTKGKVPFDNSKENIVDIFITVPLKPPVEKRVNSYYKKLSKSRKKKDNKSLLEREKVNVVILGLDSISHMNFLRTMPRVHSFLVNNLSAVGMYGLNKIGLNTFPNIAAALSSYDNFEMKKCTENGMFDKCPFVWKEYAAQGYRTSFGEDSPRMGTFNFASKRGFKTLPTDYYLRHFEEAANSLAGNSVCQGPRLSLQVLLEYLKKMATTMGRDKRYFQLVWSTALTHNYLNNAKLADKPILSTLQWFNKNGFLNQTVFILLSDHGIRWGAIRDVFQGQLEDRLPLLYYVFPKWFKQKYSGAYANLLKNVDKLTTHYDFHETLTDLLDLNSIHSDEIGNRELKLKEILKKKKKIPRGISHFIPIPNSRNCETAGVAEHFCTCHQKKVVDIWNPLVKQVANFIVHSINLIIIKSAQCAFLTLERVKQAFTIGPDNDYQLVLETSPGEAAFEATVLKGKNGRWKVSGAISRTNLYGNQSHCVTDKELKLYCYCLDFIVKNKS